MAYSSEADAQHLNAFYVALIRDCEYLRIPNDCDHCFQLRRDLPDGTDLERIVFRYIVEKYEVPLDDMTAALNEAKDDGGKALMGTIAETLEKRGEARGLAAGEALGREKGLAEGEAEGLAAGEAVWL